MILAWPKKSGAAAARRRGGLRNLCQVLGCAVVALTAGIYPCLAQVTGAPVNLGNGEVVGLHIYDVSIYSGYSTMAYPMAVTQILPGQAGLQGDVNYGGSASVGWHRHRRKTDFGVTYTGSFLGMAHYSNLNSFGQSLLISASDQLSSKWTIGLSASGQDATFPQYIFQPTGLMSTAQAPASLNDLGAAFSVGQFSSPQAATQLSGASVLQSPATAQLFGYRMLNYAGNLSLSYAASTRLSLTFSSSVGAAQTLHSQNNLPSNAYFMPRTFEVTAGFGLTYSLTPRTSIDLQLQEYKTINSFQTALGSTGTVGIGRRMGKRWFLHAQAGGSYLDSLHQTVGNSAERQWIGGASLGFKTRQNTFLADYDRTSSSAYGLATGALTMVGGSWIWQRPGSSWSLSTGYSRQQIQNTGYYSMSGWEALGGLQKALSAHFDASLQYVYLKSTGTFAGNPSALSVQMVRGSFSWKPVSESK